VERRIARKGGKGERKRVLKIKPSACGENRYHKETSWTEKRRRGREDPGKGVSGKSLGGKKKVTLPPNHLGWEDKENFYSQDFVAAVREGDHR